MFGKGLWVASVFGHLLLAILVISGDITSAAAIAVLWAAITFTGFAAALARTQCSIRTRIRLAGVSVALTLLGATVLYVDRGWHLYSFVVANRTDQHVDELWLQFRDGRSERVVELGPGETREVQVRTAAGCEDKKVTVFGDRHTVRHEYSLCVAPLLGDTEEIVLVGELDLVAKHRRWYLQLVGG